MKWLTEQSISPLAMFIGIILGNFIFDLIKAILERL